MPRRDASLAGVAAVVGDSQPRVDLDDTDLRLLQLLATDARTSQRQLAAQLGVSAPTVGDRLSRLERSGVIRGYTVQVNWEALGFGLPVYLSITATAGYDVAEIMKSLWDITEVEDITLVTGTLDLLVRLRVRDDTHLRQILMTKIWQIPGMQGTDTMLGMAEMPAKNTLSDYLDQLRNAPNNQAQTSD